MPVLKCPRCRRKVETELTGVCIRCAAALVSQLRELPRMAADAAARLAPERSGSSTSSAYGSRPAINLGMLDYAERLGYMSTTKFADDTLHEVVWDGLAMLHGWERVIREERELVDYDLVTHPEHGRLSITSTCDFLATHAQWATEQPWSDELCREVSDIHHAGRVVLREVEARIPCPGDLPDTGDLCGRMLAMPETARDHVTCPRCQRDWTRDWLIQVALANGADAWWSIEVIAAFTHTIERTIRRWATKGLVRKRGRLYSVADVAAVIRGEEIEATA